MLSAGNGVRLDTKAFLGQSSHSSFTLDQPPSEDQRRAELRARTGFDRTPLERLFSDLFSLKSAKTGAALGSAGLFGCGFSPGANPNPVPDEPWDKEGPRDGGILDGREAGGVDAQAKPVNRPPVLEPVEDQTVNEEELLELRLAGSDPDGDPGGDGLIYSAALASGTPLPEGMSFDPETGLLSWTPGCLYSGIYPMVFSVTDDGTPALSASQEAEIEVVDRCVEVEWTQTHHSGERDSGNGIVVEFSGNIFVTGEEDVIGQFRDVWTRKYDPDGTEVWTERHNGLADSDDEGRGIAVDPSGNIYVVGLETVPVEGSNIWLRKYRNAP